MAISPHPTPRRTITNIALWALQVIVAGFFLMSAVAKFTDAEPAASTFEEIGWGDWFRYLIGVLEAVGVVGLLIPRLAGAAGLGLAGLMVGATLTEAFVTGGGVVLPLALLVLSAVIAWGRREGVRALVARR
ncbi:DoxX family protein [Nonomuraea sp. NPDC046802]|uniref:DoxX family protein n=1 Tax=Nonomuraea sp. NPDC046802 TaxID=3154919 RepID=UPI0033FB544D